MRPRRVAGGVEDERVGLLLVEQQVDTVDPERHPVHGGCRRTAQLHGGGDDGRFWAGNGSVGRRRQTPPRPRGARVRGAVRRARACDEQAREDRRDHEAVESPALLRQAQIRSPHAGSCSRFRGRPAAGPEHLAISRGRRVALLRFLDRPGALHGMVMGSSRPSQATTTARPVATCGDRGDRRQCHRIHHHGYGLPFSGTCRPARHAHRETADRKRRIRLGFLRHYHARRPMDRSHDVRPADARRCRSRQWVAPGRPRRNGPRGGHAARRVRPQAPLWTAGSAGTSPSPVATPPAWQRWPPPQ